MEQMGAMSEGEWNNYGGIYSTTEEADFMAQLLGNCSLPNELPNGGSNLAWPVHESDVNMAAMDENSMYSSDDNATNVYCFSQSSSYSGGTSVLFPSSSSHDGYYPSDSHHVYVTNNSSMSMDYFMVEAKNTNNLMEGDDFLNQDASNDSMESNENLTESVLHGTALQLGREHEMPLPESSTEEKMSSPSDIAKKRSRIPSDVQKNKRSVKPKKNQRVASSGNDEEEKKAVLQRQNSIMSCSSEDDSNASQELNGGVTSSSCSKGAGALNSSGKTRASRGSATDPQSLYARKRRERINERLKILQNLVPNGTKVDISTMLEEAVQYVKFLQLQIKLLSSDDLWMYSPIAYNGMDIGLDLKIATSKS